MSEMIEKVAKAIDPMPWSDLAAKAWDKSALKAAQKAAMAQARDAIEAMREPTKEMWQAGTDAIEETKDFSTDTEGTYEVTTPSDYPGPCWRAMIDAALSTPSASERK